MKNYFIGILEFTVHISTFTFLVVVVSFVSFTQTVCLPYSFPFSVLHTLLYIQIDNL